MDLSSRTQKFIGSVVSVLRGRVFGAEDVYIHLIKIKRMLLLFYDVNCLRVDRCSCYEKTECDLEYSVALGFGCLHADLNMRNKLKQCGTMFFQVLIDIKFLPFSHTLKCCNTTSLLLHWPENWYDSKSEAKKLSHNYGLWSITCSDTIRPSVVKVFDLHSQCI